LKAGVLLVVAWTAAPRPGRRDRLAFLFAGPHLTHTDLHLIRLDPGEVDAWQLAAQPAAAHLLHPLQAQRLQARSTTTGSTIYLEQPAPTG
jgi:8-oxo-dGTP diphosphatase